MADRLAARTLSQRPLFARHAGVRSARAFIDWRPIRLLLLIAIALYAIGFTVRAYTRRYFVFLPDYARWMLAPRPGPFTKGPTHIFLVFTDHFEPDYDSTRVAEWTR